MSTMKNFFKHLIVQDMSIEEHLNAIRLEQNGFNSLNGMTR